MEWIPSLQNLKQTLKQTLKQNLEHLVDAKRYCDTNNTSNRLITRYGPPDTHGATWACDANDSRCTGPYGENAKDVNKCSLNVCIENAKLWNLVDDADIIKSLLDEYECERSEAIYNLMTNALIGAVDTFATKQDNKKIYIENKYACWSIEKATEKDYKIIDGEERVLVEHSLPVFYFALDNIQLPIPVPKGLVNGGKRTFREEGRPHSVWAYEVPSIRIKSNDQGLTRICVARNHVCPQEDYYSVKTELLARQQLAGPVAIITDDVKQIMKTHAVVNAKRQLLEDGWFGKIKSSGRYLRESLLVRLNDHDGRDEAIIDFMKWAYEREEIDGFITSGMVDMQATKENAGPRILAPEIFLVGPHAEEVSKMWKRWFGDFKDRYTSDMIAFSRRPNIDSNKSVRIDEFANTQTDPSSTREERINRLKSGLEALGYTTEVVSQVGKTVS